MRLRQRCALWWIALAAALVRENLELNKQIKTLEGDVVAARKRAEEAEARTPDYNEKGYFQNLQNAMRESLIGAQRIADETTEEANRKAQKTVSDAQARADQITVSARDKADALVSKAQEEADAISAEAKNRVDTLEARYEALKASAAAYKEQFSRMLDQQANALREANGLF